MSKGVGALSSPLVATQFSVLSRWSFHYLTSLGVALLNTILLVVVFRLKDQDGLINAIVFNSCDAYCIPLHTACLAEIGQTPIHEANGSAADNGSKYKQMFKLRSLHLMAIFILVYVGVEVTLGGSFLSILRPRCSLTIL